MQCSLLRILEDRVVCRIGGSKYHPVNVRIVAATNRDLWKCVQRGTFRLDLYFRLNVIRIELPPLRDRTGDIDILVPYLLERAARKNRVPMVAISGEVMELFRRYYWPGNVRELKNVVEKCAVMTTSDTVTLENLPKDVLRQLSSSGGRLRSRGLHGRLFAAAGRGACRPGLLRRFSDGEHKRARDPRDRGAHEEIQWKQEQGGKRAGHLPQHAVQAPRRDGLRPPAGAKNSRSNDRLFYFAFRLLCLERL